MAGTRPTRKAKEKCKKALSTRSKPSKETPKKADENPECAICLDKVSIRGKLGVCEHWFCFSCIQEWSKNTNTCPLCKKRFRAITKIGLAPNSMPAEVIRIRDREQIVFHDDDDDEYDDDYEDDYDDDEDYGVDIFSIMQDLEDYNEDEPSDDESWTHSGYLDYDMQPRILDFTIDVDENDNDDDDNDDDDNDDDDNDDDDDDDNDDDDGNDDDNDAEEEESDADDDSDEDHFDNFDIFDLNCDDDDDDDYDDNDDDDFDDDGNDDEAFSSSSSDDFMFGLKCNTIGNKIRRSMRNKTTTVCHISDKVPLKSSTKTRQRKNADDMPTPNQYGWIDMANKSSSNCHCTQQRGSNLSPLTSMRSDYNKRNLLCLNESPNYKEKDKNLLMNAEKWTLHSNANSSDKENAHNESPFIKRRSRKHRIAIVSTDDSSSGDDVIMSLKQKRQRITP